MRPAPGDLVAGKYRVLRLIGDGGMGSVYEARHELLGTPVALKFLHPELARRTGVASRFLQEARVSASIESPHVTRVTDVDQTPDGSVYLVMEFLSGETLQKLLDRTGRLERDLAIDLALQVLSGLEAAHARGVVHRDLKPDNVFIVSSPGGPLAKILDFGIAKLRHSGPAGHALTRPGAVMGTPEYMPPEQLYAASQVDVRADIYSLGAMLYEMLSGKRPASGEDVASIISQVVQGRVQPLRELNPELPAGLCAVVHRALEPDRERRWPTAQQMRLALVPFAGRLSHAGRLAAAYGSELPEAPSPGEAQSLASGTGAHPGARGVPPTLPPEVSVGPVASPSTAPRANTQDLPEQVLKEVASSLQDPALTPQPAYVPGPAGGWPGPLPAPGAPLPRPPPPRARRATGALGAVLALLLGLVLTGAAILALVLLRNREEEPPPWPADAAAPLTTLEPQPPEPPVAGLNTVPQAPVAGTPPARPQPAAGTRKDAGTEATAEAGWPGPGLPIPSSFPGFPPELPGLIPSVLPPLFPPPSHLEPNTGQSL